MSEDCSPTLVHALQRVVGEGVERRRVAGVRSYTRVHSPQHYGREGPGADAIVWTHHIM